MTNLDSILKSRDITLLIKVRLVKAVVFPIAVYGCESWTIKEAVAQRINSFEPWYWKSLLRVPWTARRSNKSILKEISPEYSLEEGLMLKLKLQYFGHLMWRTDSSENTLIWGKYWRQEKKGMTEDEMVGWHHWLDEHEFEQALGFGDRQRNLVCCSPWGRKESDTTEQLKNWEWAWPCLLLGFFGSLNETMHEKNLAWHLAQSRCLINACCNYDQRMWKRDFPVDPVVESPSYNAGCVSQGN